MEPTRLSRNVSDELHSILRGVIFQEVTDLNYAAAEPWSQTFHFVSFCVISDFRREVEENCVLLGHYAARNGNSLRTFWDNLLVHLQGLLGFLTLEDGVDRFPETSVRNYHYPLRNDPEELISHHVSFCLIYPKCYFHYEQARNTPLVLPYGSHHTENEHSD